MAKFDRYLLSQFLTHFGFFALVLVSVYWINRAVSLFDQLIANGQSASVFFAFSALALPNVIRIVLPVAAFAGVVYVTNRLQSESELVVVQATGYSPLRLARPVFYFGVIVALFMSVLTHILAPISTTMLAEKTEEISENITARLLTEGQFLHPVSGITFYIREVTPLGELKDIFIEDARKEGRRTTYTARTALIVRHEDGPRIAMFDGSAQTLNLETRQLSLTAFDDLVYDLSPLIPAAKTKRRSIREIPTPELLVASEATQEETLASAATLKYEAHERITQALLAMIAPIVGFAVLMIGGFSRFGLWRQIFGAIFALILIKAIDNGLADAARSDTTSLWLSYVAPSLGLFGAFALLKFAGRNRRQRSARSTGELVET